MNNQRQYLKPQIRNDPDMPNSEKLKYDHLLHEELTFNFFDMWGLYLIKDAKCRGGPRKGKKIMMNSGDRYFSVIKCAIMYKLNSENKKNDSLTDPKSMRSIRDGIIA